MQSPRRLTIGDVAGCRYMIAGAMAGVSEHCVMFPMDTVKTRMQVAGSVETSLVGTARLVCPPPPPPFLAAYPIRWSALDDSRALLQQHPLTCAEFPAGESCRQGACGQCFAA